MVIKNTPTVTGIGELIDLADEITLQEQNATAKNTTHLGIILDELSTIDKGLKKVTIVLLGNNNSFSSSLFHGNISPQQLFGSLLENENDFGSRFINIFAFSGSFLSNNNLFHGNILGGPGVLQNIANDTINNTNSLFTAEIVIVENTMIYTEDTMLYSDDTMNYGA